MNEPPSHDDSSAEQAEPPSGLDAFAFPLQLAMAAGLYALLVLLAQPNAWAFLHTNLIAYEGGDAIYRIHWFARVFWGDADSIWQMPDLLYPYGIPTTMQAAGLLKELLVALLGGGANPWLANNLIHVSTPITVGLAGFVAMRCVLRFGFWPALVAGWLVAWTGSWARLLVVPWLNAQEATLPYLALLVALRGEDDPRRRLRLGIGAGACAGIATWLCAQNLVHVALIGAIYAVDRLIARRWRDLLPLAIAAILGGVIASPLLARTWLDYGGNMSLMAGDIRSGAPYTSATLSELIAPHPDSLLLGWLTQFVHEHVFHVRGWWTSYLGWTAMALVIVGVASRRRGSGFLLAVAATAAVLAMGPAIAINNSQFSAKGLPGPFALLMDAPIFGTMREIRRYAITSQLAIGLLAGYGVAHLASRARIGRRLPALALAVILLQTLEITPERSAIVSGVLKLDPEPAFLDTIRAEPGDFAVLDIPYFPGSHIFMRHGAQHRKGVIWAIAGRLPGDHREAMERAFRFPGIVIWEEKDDPTDFTDFARALADYNVRYIIVHRQYIDHEPALRDRIARLLDSPATWSGQSFVHPPQRVHDDATMIVWRVERLPGVEPLPEVRARQR